MVFRALCQYLQVVTDNWKVALNPRVLSYPGIEMKFVCRYCLPSVSDTVLMRPDRPKESGGLQLVIIVFSFVCDMYNSIWASFLGNIT